MAGNALAQHDRGVISRVAIAGGTIGRHIATSLINTGSHTVTALSRKGSSNTLPSSVHVCEVDYDDEATLIAALSEQQILIITMAPTAPRDTHSKLVRAVAKAGVRYIMPNSYGPDIEDVKLGEDTLLGPVAKTQRDEIESLGMQWIAVCCGFWYEYSLAGGESRFGFDFDQRSITVYDDGSTAISASRLSHVGEAVAKVLSLPKNSLAKFLNKGVYIQSFCVSQMDIFESVKRASCTTDADWKVSHESTKERYADGLNSVRQGNLAGFSKMLYARAFFPDQSSDLSAKAQNITLGLTEDSLDDATRAGIEMVQELQLRNERMAA